VFSEKYLNEFFLRFLFLLRWEGVSYSVCYRIYLMKSICFFALLCIFISNAVLDKEWKVARDRDE